MAEQTPLGMEIAARLEQAMVDYQKEMTESGQAIPAASLMFGVSIFLTRVIAEVLYHLPEPIQDAAMRDMLSRVNALCTQEYSTVLTELLKQYELANKQAILH